MRISDWSSDVCSSDLRLANPLLLSSNAQRAIYEGAFAVERGPAVDILQNDQQVAQQPTGHVDKRVQADISLRKIKVAKHLCNEGTTEMPHKLRVLGCGALRVDVLLGVCRPPAYCISKVGTVTP